MNKHFALIEDTEEKPATFTKVGPGCYAFTTDGDPNSGVIIGETSVLIVDAQPTPAAAQKVMDCVRSVTDKPIKYVVLTHYHAVRSLGASAYEASDIITSDLTKRLIAKRGEADWAAQNSRFPRLFKDGGDIPGLTWPTLSFASSMSLDLGGREVRLMHLGRGHTMGDVVVWVPGSGVLFAGDLVENKAACYCGDAHLADWPRALERIAAFRPKAIVPGRGNAVVGSTEVADAMAETRDFIVTLRETAADCVDAGKGLKDTFVSVKQVMDGRFGAYTLYDQFMPFNVARAYDEALGLDRPQTWTPERDEDLWDALYGAADPAPEPELTLVEDGPDGLPETPRTEPDKHSVSATADEAGAELDPVLELDDTQIIFESAEQTDLDAEGPARESRTPALSGA